MEERKGSILLVDDEANILGSLRRLLRRENYELLTATSAEEGLKILEQREVNLIISDQRMPGMQGVEFLKKAMELCPDTIRIILSGYTDVDTVTAAINEGRVYQFILKPWNDEELKITIKRALEQYELQMENKKLIEDEETEREFEDIESRSGEGSSAEGAGIGDQKQGPVSLPGAPRSPPVRGYENRRGRRDYPC